MHEGGVTYQTNHPTNPQPTADLLNVGSAASMATPKFKCLEQFETQGMSKTLIDGIMM